MDPRLVTAIFVIIGVPATVIGYVFVIEQLLKLIPARRQEFLPGNTSKKVQPIVAVTHDKGTILAAPCAGL